MGKRLMPNLKDCHLGLEQATTFSPLIGHSYKEDDKIN